MTLSEFKSHCTQVEGDKCATILSGVKKVFPEDYDTVESTFESVHSSEGKAHAIVYLMDWLRKHGICLDGDVQAV